MVRICFVCLGNICRSPTAEGVMQHRIAARGLDHAVRVDSAGTGGWHVGERADGRARQAAKKRGIDLNSRARQFSAADFDRFDYVVAMDTDNLRTLQGMTTTDRERAKLHLLRAFDPESPTNANIPDPYYGGPTGFEEVLDLCEAACDGLLAHIRDHHGIG